MLLLVILSEAKNTRISEGSEATRVPLPSLFCGSAELSYLPATPSPNHPLQFRTSHPGLNSLSAVGKALCTPSVTTPSLSSSRHFSTSCSEPSGSRPSGKHGSTASAAPCSNSQPPAAAHSSSTPSLWSEPSFWRSSSPGSSRPPATKRQRAASSSPSSPGSASSSQPGQRSTPSKPAA